MRVWMAKQTRGRSSMIETSTTWKDSGYDCDHCGGKIMTRIDHETGQPDLIRYQCEECGCLWSESGEVERVGSGEYCKAAQRARDGRSEPEWTRLLSRSLWILLALIAGVILLRFGGGLVLRFVLPLVLLGGAAYLLFRYGQQRMWW